ncbi:lytic murein transglycosylase [Microbacteriaceae bacterium K1510]|nr:lytic murein transglycosylase [Microbacteriaceae bacterium K1510]
MSLSLGVMLSGQALAATCQNGVSFERWLEDFKKEALASGIKPQVLAAASPYMKFEQRIVNRDRAQGVFNQSFLKFSDRLIPATRLQRGEAQISSHTALFAKVEKEFGVPAPILTAFWGLESDFGTNTGNSNIFGALSTLAYDCRRPDYFRPQLMDALRIVQRGDLTVDEMMGGDWAGELGAMQFTASDYYKNALDYDGDGKRNLVKSTPDTVASAANFLKNLGWKRGEPWLQEVRLTKDLPWDQADLTIQLPISQWKGWGVKPAYGSLPADATKAALLLPMGRKGPAFLAYENFQVLQGWNNSMVYVTTVAYFATRLAGAPPVHRGDPDIEVMQPNDVSELQRILIRMGEDIGEPDGKVGAKTRAAIKRAQMKVGLPADSYPSTELLQKLRAQASR